MRTSNTLKLMVLPFMLAACSRGFEPQSVAIGSSDTQGVSSSASKSETLVTGRGELKTSKKSLKDQSVELNFEMNIPFGRVYSTLSSVVRKSMPSACKLVDDVKSLSSDQYAEGEIPCGVPYSTDWKKLVDLKFDGYQKDDTRVYPFDLPVLLSKKQYRGIYKESRLDTKKVESLTSSFKLGEDVSVRYQPNGMNSRVELCMNVPGAAVRAPETKVKAQAKKRILGFKVSKTADFKVNPGQAKYEYGRGCFALDMKWHEGHGMSTDLSSTLDPYLKGVQYEGFHIRIQDWFLRLIDNIMSVFNSSIREKIMNQVKSTVNKVADRDVESGVWFTRVHGEELLDKGGKKFNQKARDVIARIGAPSNKAEYLELLSDNCRILKFGVDNWNQKLEQFCSNVVDRMDISVQPFVAHTKSKELGCYNHFANVHMTKSNGNPQWWSTQCKFSAKVTVNLPADYKDYLNELKEVMKTHIDQKQIPEKWQGKLAELKLDAFKLSLVLKELEDRGVSQINDHDWKTTIPNVIAELQDKDLLN